MNSRLVFAFPIALMLSVALALSLLCNLSQGQVSSTIPRAAYFGTFTEFYIGDYQDAGRDFSRGANTAFRFGNERFLDSTCYWTMVGECHFHQGNYRDALANYDQALNLYLAFNRNSWQNRINPPRTLSARSGAFTQSRVNWGTPRRTVKIPSIPSTFGVQFGRTDAGRAFQEGGTFDQAELRQVAVSEIMRCTALALHRRKFILGGLNEVDPLTAQLVASLSSNRNAGDGSIMGSYNGVLAGIAMASTNKLDEAAVMLNKSLQINGEFDHPLTPVALLELATIARVKGKPAQVNTFALEASYSAGIWNQYDLVQEAMAIGTLNHLATSKTPYPPLTSVISWANRERARHLQLAATQRLAECHAEAGNTSAARQVIATTANLFRTNRSRPLRNTASAARIKYSTALSSFLEGKSSAGRTELSAALTDYRKHSLWLNRLNIATTRIRSGAMSERLADRVLESLLHDPSETEWKFDPIEPMAFLGTDHVSAMELWFEILLKRKRFERAAEIAELIRRHRFYSTLPLGGRLLAFRHGLTADPQDLDAETLKQRNDFLQANQNFVTLMNESNRVIGKLEGLPLKPDAGSPEEKEQAKFIRDLGKLAANQENLLAHYSLQRKPSNLSFPPSPPFQSFKAKLKRGELCLSFLKTSDKYHMFFINAHAAGPDGKHVRHVELGKTKQLESLVQRLLKEIGAIGAAADGERIQNEKWKELLVKVKETLFARIPDEKFREIVKLKIVPDGILWYLPIEAIPLEINGVATTLVEQFPISYSPTLYLAASRSAAPKIEKVMVLAGQMHPRGETQQTTDAITELTKAIPDAATFERDYRLPSSLHAWTPDHLMLWNHVNIPKDAFQFTPIPFDKSEFASVNSWMSLPAKSPECISLPGLRPFEKRKVDGSEMFLLTTGMMAAGSKTVLMSRWPGGGKAAIELSRIYTENLKTLPPPQALRDAIAKTRALDFEPEKEPHLKFDPEKDPNKLDLNHPFFWASFVVVDAGGPPPVNGNAAPAPAPWLQPIPNPNNPVAGPNNPPAAPPAGAPGTPPAAGTPATPPATGSPNPPVDPTQPDSQPKTIPAEPPTTPAAPPVDAGDSGSGTTTGNGSGSQ